MIIINYIPKVQAIDKSAAMLAQIREDFQPNQILSIINIDEKNQIDNTDTLISLLGLVSDRLLFVGKSNLHLRAYEFVVQQGWMADFLSDQPDELLLQLANINSGYQVKCDLFLIPFTGERSKIGQILVRYFKKRSAKIVSYFKSLHDQGYGLTVENKKINKSYLLSINKLLFKVKKQLKTISSSGLDNVYYKLPPDIIDVILTFNESHDKLIREKVRGPKTSIAGYQLTYPAWLELISKFSSQIRNVKSQLLEVVLFTRGETPGRAPEDNIVSKQNLKVLIGDILDGLDHLGRNYRVRIKPHPIQDVDFLRTVVNSRKNVSITYQPPSVLVSSADLTISTYSSTVIDAIIFGVPTIEYFFESSFFKKKHPTGSPFIQYGVLPARNRVEFFDALSKIASNDFSKIDFNSKFDMVGNTKFMCHIIGSSQN